MKTLRILDRWWFWLAFMIMAELLTTGNFVISTILLFVGLAGLIRSIVRAAIARKRRGPPSDWYCPVCGTVARPRTVTKGNFGLEFFLWLLFIIPGLIYTLWRISNQSKGCPACKAIMIPGNSPVAREAMAHRQVPAQSG
jgi:hypothetical protein